MADVTVVIPSIRPRLPLLQRAIGSVQRQTVPCRALHIEFDLDHSGAWTSRNRGLWAARSTWTAFLDDDDEFLPTHLEHLLDVAEEHDADMVWGWFTVFGGDDPFPHYRGRQYDISQPHIVPITYMARTELLQCAAAEMGGFQHDGGVGAWDTQDMPLINKVVELGGKLYASERTTWVWHHHGRNTSGMPERW